MFFAHGTSNSHGALITFREGLNLKVISSHLNDNGRYVILKVEIQSSPFILINSYAPNEEGQQVQILDIPLQRGTRQGYPLSAYLFILALEVFEFKLEKMLILKALLSMRLKSNFQHTLIMEASL